MSALARAAEPASGPLIRIKDLQKWYGNYHALRRVNLEVAAGERIVLRGPSGSGKSTLIRCVNRLEKFQEGAVTVNGVSLDGNLKNVDAVRREVGMVFQHFHLFSHMSVLDKCLMPQVLASGPRGRKRATSRCTS